MVSAKFTAKLIFRAYLSRIQFKFCKIKPKILVLLKTFIDHVFMI